MEAIGFYDGFILDAEAMQDLREVLARIEGDLVEQRRILNEVREWVIAYRRPVSGMEDRFGRVEAELTRLRERIVSLETQHRVRVWLIGTMSGTGAGVAMWILNHLLR